MRIATLTTRLAGAGAAGAMLLTCLSACGTTASAGEDLVTLRQARQVAGAYLHAPLPAEVAEERGSLQRIDQGFEAMRTPGPEPTPDTKPHDDVIWLAHQSQYPVSFLCYDKSLQPGSPAAGQLFRFSKASASAPWTVTHQVLLLSLASKPALALDSAGYAQMIPPSDYGKLLVSPAKLGKDWAAYLTAGNLADAHEFAPGAITTNPIQERKKQQDDAAAHHQAITVSYAPSADAVDAYVLKDGSALVLVGLEATAHQVATTGSITITQDGKGIAGPPPGKYHDITNHILVLGAFTVPPKGSTVKVSAVGAFYGTVLTTANKS